MHDRIVGHTDGLKASQFAALEKLLRRDRSDQIIAPQLAARLTRISSEIRRTVGLLLDRGGNVSHVIVGDAHRLYLPDIGRQRAGTTRLRGLRLVRTNLDGAELRDDDLTDLSKLRFDLVAAIEVNSTGLPGRVSWAHLRPDGAREPEVHGPLQLGELDLRFIEFIDQLEEEIGRRTEGTRATTGTAGMLVYVRLKGDYHSEERIEELKELAKTAGLELVGTVVQGRTKADPRTHVGSDKLEEIELKCLDLGADILLFGQDLSPSQARAISERTELKVLDRTQLILDIFAQHAKSRGGKLQVELAQLRYSLPRLVGKTPSLSRLMGGVGGRGPGETKLEIDRRRARDRIRRLEQEIEHLSSVRVQQRQRRKSEDIPIAAIVGYTNAGKSTLLNTLTHSDVVAREQLFATLDPTARRLRFPNERNLILTDTVGFIHDLPPDLVKAFRATLEELEEAHLLLHVVDVSSEGYERRIEAVQGILQNLGLAEKPQLLVFNKMDRMDREVARNLARSHNAIAISAKDESTLAPLAEEIQRRLWAEELKRGQTDGRAGRVQEIRS